MHIRHIFLLLLVSFGSLSINAAEQNNRQRISAIEMLHQPQQQQTQELRHPNYLATLLTVGGTIPAQA